MKNVIRAVILIGLTTLLLGCVEKKVDTDLLDTPDKKALYDLMVARCEALNKAELKLFEDIYVHDSPELGWISNTGIPMWRQNGMRYNVQSLKKLSVINDDAAGRFVLVGYNRSGTRFVKSVEALFIKQDGQWKIESTGER